MSFLVQVRYENINTHIHTRTCHNKTCLAYYHKIAFHGHLHGNVKALVRQYYREANN